MARSRKIIPFFTDQNVPDSVGKNLVTAGHQLTRLRDVMDPDTPDPIILVACSKTGQVLITHDKDFKTLAKRLNITQRQYQNVLHRIQLRCSEPESASRIMDALLLIEAEWRLVKKDRPMVIEITSNAIKTYR